MTAKGPWPKNAKGPWPKNAKGPWPNNLVRKKELEQQIWNEIESSHFALPLHTQPGLAPVAFPTWGTQAQAPKFALK